MTATFAPSATITSPLDILAAKVADINASLRSRWACRRAAANAPVMPVRRLDRGAYHAEVAALRADAAATATAMLRTGSTIDQVARKLGQDRAVIVELVRFG